MEAVPGIRSLTEQTPSSAWRAHLVANRNALGLGVAIIALVVAIRAGVAPRTGGPDLIESIAVLPLDHRSGTDDLEYLTDGIAEGVISRLSELRSLRVIARGTMFIYKGRNVDPRAVGRELGVRAVLAGQVTRQHDRIVARLELIDTGDGSRIWGGEYRRLESELSALPGDIALALSREMSVHLTGQQEKQLARDYTRSAEAYQLYLKGRYFWNKRTADGYVKAIEHFTGAIDRDPTFALAYSGLADAYLMRRGYGILSTVQSIPQAKAAAEHALKIDDTLAEAHTSLAPARTNLPDWAGAEAAFRRAMELNPNYATAHHWYAMYLAMVWRLDEAMTAIRRAQALDPLSLIINTEVGRLLYFSRQYDAAIAQYSRTLEMDPHFALAHLHLGTVLIEKGSYAEAIAEIQQAAAVGGPIVAVSLGRAYALAGRQQEAEEVRKPVIESSKHGFAPPFAMATLYTDLGDDERAIDWLEKGARDGGAWFLKVHPRWDRLRSNPRFQAVMRQAGLVP